MGVLVPADSSGRQPGPHQAEYDFLHERNSSNDPDEETRSSQVEVRVTETCVCVLPLTQQSSEAWQVLCLEPELPGGLRQQVLVCGQVLAVPAQFERV